MASPHSNSQSMTERNIDAMSPRSLPQSNAPKITFKSTTSPIAATNSTAAPRLTHSDTHDSIKSQIIPSQRSFIFKSPAKVFIQNPTTSQNSSVTTQTLDTPVASTASITKAELQSTLSTSLAPKSGILPSQNPNLSPAQVDQQPRVNLETDTKPITSRSIPPTTPEQLHINSTVAVKPGQTSPNTIEVVRHSTSMPLLTQEPKASTRRVKNYTLADGSIVSGKGLGRGRPGVKRGPRNSKYGMEEPAMMSASSFSIYSSPLSTQTPDQKRKRADSDVSNAKTQRSVSSSLELASRDSSVEYNPVATETRSGRKSQKPVSLISQTTGVSSPANKMPKLDPTPSTTQSPSSIKTHPKIKRRIYRGRESLALCEHCLRGYGPPGNAIVFCDACNKCWHQRCHDPQVPKETVNDAKAEWFCADCDRILHGKKAKKPTAAKISISSSSTQPPYPTQPVKPTYGGPLVGGAGMPKEHKMAYLNSLDKDQLIKLIMQATDLAPALPFFQALLPPPPPVPQAQFTSNYVTPVSKPFVFDSAQGQDQDEGYDDYFDEHAALYPKTGNGVQLPPESVDMHMLLESRHSRTFSHWVKGMPGKEFSGNANVIAAKA